MTYHGECFCGAVKVEATGEPEGMGLLPLQFVQIVVRQPGKRLHVVEA